MWTGGHIFIMDTLQIKEVSYYLFDTIYNTFFYLERRDII